MAAERCQELILGCSSEMGPLLANIQGVSQYCHRWTDVPGHAAHCRLSSLPYLFRTQLDTIPSRIPYLKADPARIAHWRHRLDATLATRPSALDWPGPAGPRIRTTTAVDAAVPAGASGGCWDSGVRLATKTNAARDLAALPRFSGMIDLSEDLTDFGETAALMENLD